MASITCRRWLVPINAAQVMSMTFWRECRSRNQFRSIGWGKGKKWRTGWCCYPCCFSLLNMFSMLHHEVVQLQTSNFGISCHPRNWIRWTIYTVTTLAIEICPWKMLGSLNGHWDKAGRTWSRQQISLNTSWYTGGKQTLSYPWTYQKLQVQHLVYTRNSGKIMEYLNIMDCQEGRHLGEN